MTNLIRSTTELALHIACSYIKPGADVVDATCGNGRDTLALAKSMYPGGGRLFAFDVQKQAIHATRTLLVAEGFGRQLDEGNIKLIQASHENMDKYLSEACLIVFNLGYLPGGDKATTTCTVSTMTAVKKALELLSPDGLVSLAMYSGHEEGAKEKNELLDFAGNLDRGKYHVAYVNLLNQPKNPPELLLITRKR